MKLAYVEQLVDIARSYAERVLILEKALPKLRGKDVRTALIMLAKLYFFCKESLTKQPKHTILLVCTKKQSRHGLGFHAFHVFPLQK